MQLSNHARDVLDTSIRQKKINDAEIKDIEYLISSLPQDKVVIYKNVVSNPIGDIPSS